MFEASIDAVIGALIGMARSLVHPIILMILRVPLADLVPLLLSA